MAWKLTLNAISAVIVPIKDRDETAPEFALMLMCKFLTHSLSGGWSIQHAGKKKGI